PDPIDGTMTIIYPDNFMQRIGRAGPIEPSYVCLQARDGLTAIDPITGRTLWVRGDRAVTSRAHLFGDEQTVYVVEMNQSNNPTGTRALRAHDGAALSVPDFGSVYQLRQRVIGRTILVSENRDGKTVLRLHDVQAAKDVWNKEFPSGSVILKSEEPHLAGGIEPSGKVTVLALRKQTAVMGSQPLA